MSPPECNPSIAHEPIPLLDLNANHENVFVPFLNTAKSASFHVQQEQLDVEGKARVEAVQWRPDMTSEEKAQRREWLSVSRGRSGLRIVIVTGGSTASVTLDYKVET